jgi:hypothetical protein
VFVDVLVDVGPAAPSSPPPDRNGTDISGVGGNADSDADADDGLTP